MSQSTETDEDLGRQDLGQGIRSVAKALGLLERVGELGVAQVGRLSADAHLPKATVVRILQALASCGYIRQVNPRAGYCLTSKVELLGSRFAGVAALLEAGASELDALTATTKWPASLAALDSNGLIIIYSTASQSPHAHTPPNVGKRLSIATTAHGRALTANLSVGQRDALRAVERLRDVIDALPQPVLEEVRVRGYAKRVPPGESGTGYIAAPILSGGLAVGTLGLAFFASAVESIDQVRLGRTLVDTAARITERLKDVRAHTARQLGSRPSTT